MAVPEVALRLAGRTRYGAALAEQRALRAHVQSGCTAPTLLLTEHWPVFTFGRNAAGTHLHITEQQAAARGIDVAWIERGGDVTYHAPGQLVAYPILDLSHFGRDVRRYVWRLEETAVQLLQTFGLAGERRPGTPGVWAGPRKIASVGVHISRWVTLHGIAINIDMDLAPFSLIDPCGLVGMEMTSIARELGYAAPLEEALARYPGIFAAVFGCVLRDPSAERGSDA